MNRSFHSFSFVSLCRFSNWNDTKGNQLVSIQRFGLRERCWLNTTHDRFSVCSIHNWLVKFDDRRTQHKTTREMNREKYRNMPGNWIATEGTKDRKIESIRQHSRERERKEKGEHQIFRHAFTTTPFAPHLTWSRSLVPFQFKSSHSSIAPFFA